MQSSAEVRLSVIVPVHGVESYLARCLQSLADQDLDATSMEIIVIDDGSPDGSRAVAEDFAARDPRFRIHSQPNRGLGAARNVGMDLARGRYVWFVDGDDHVEPAVAKAMVEAMERLDLDMLSFDYIRVPAATEVEPSIVAADTSGLRATDGREHIAQRRFTAEAWGYLYRHELLTRHDLRFPEGRLIEDVVLVATALSLAARVAWWPRVVYCYVQRPGSIMNLREAAHTRRLLEGFEWVIDGLRALRVAAEADPSAPPGYVERLRLREQAAVFFFVGRLVRSELPMQPMLSDRLRRFRAAGSYPLTTFPGAEFPGVHYRALTWMVNHPRSMRVVAGAFRVVARTRAHIRR